MEARASAVEARAPGRPTRSRRTTWITSGRAAGSDGQLPSSAVPSVSYSPPSAVLPRDGRFRPLTPPPMPPRAPFRRSHEVSSAASNLTRASSTVVRRRLTRQHVTEGLRSMASRIRSRWRSAASDEDPDDDKAAREKSSSYWEARCQRMLGVRKRAAARPGSVWERSKSTSVSLVLRVIRNSSFSHVCRGIASMGWYSLCPSR